MVRSSHPSQFEPLLPQSRLGELRALGGEVVERSQRLSGCVHPSTSASLRELLRAMNSYYSNRIEGQSTHPLHIERALHKRFSARADVARLQRIAVAHIDAERELESCISDGASALTSVFVQQAHRSLYARLSEDDRRSAEGAVIEPGKLRGEQVIVGRHTPPDADALPRFLARFDDVYSRPTSTEDLLLTVAAAHQRMTWIHPFPDGNGRATRLQTHAALWPISAGLWSPNRGLARQRDEYYRHLDAADAPRQGDLDGRGNLSEKALADWCLWFVALCADQVDFMTRMLNLDEMKTRIQALVTFRATQDKSIRNESILPLIHLFAAGPTTRGAFQQMTGLGERSARSLLARLLETGLVTSEGHKAPVRFAFPLDALHFLLPELYPEAATLPPD